LIDIKPIMKTLNMLHKSSRSKLSFFCRKMWGKFWG